MCIFSEMERAIGVSLVLVAVLKKVRSYILNAPFYLQLKFFKETKKLSL
jgi:hypothetical protein